MSHEQDTGCREYNDLSRRQFLGSTAATAVLTSLLPAWMPKVAFASDYNATRDIILSVYLRGGMDGLTLCAPYADSNYHTWRPTISVKDPNFSDATRRAVDLDGYFGVPQAMKPLKAVYDAGDMLFVHASGSNDPTRSHFEAQRFMEVGKPADPRIGDGWLGRHLASSPPIKDGATLRGIGLLDGLPRTLFGGPQTLPIPNPGSFTLAGQASTRPARSTWLHDVYGGIGDPLKSSAVNSLDTINLLGRIDFNNYHCADTGVPDYGTSGFAKAIKYSAALIANDTGVEAIHVDRGGWDTHGNQLPFAGGMATTMSDLSGALLTFYADLIARNITNFTIVVVTEFGRKVQENGSKGTDHGHGGVMQLIGPAIKGGQVINSPANPYGYNNWPGIAREQLDRGQDLKIALDYRNVLVPIVQKRLQNDNIPFIFPDFAWDPSLVNAVLK